MRVTCDSLSNKVMLFLVLICGLITLGLTIFQEPQKADGSELSIPTQEQTTQVYFKNLTILPDDVIGLFWCYRYGYCQGPGHFPWERDPKPGDDVPVEDEYAFGGDNYYGPPWPPLVDNWN